MQAIYCLYRAKRNKAKERRKYCFFDERKTEQPTKKETIYNTIYSKERKRVKTATNRHKKRGTKKSL